MVFLQVFCSGELRSGLYSIETGPTCTGWARGLWLQDLLLQDVQYAEGHDPHYLDDKHQHNDNDEIP